MVCVEWRDATNLNENVWTSLDAILEQASNVLSYRAITVGWLIHDGGDYLLIAQSWDPSRRNVTDVIAIQTCMVDAIVHLQHDLQHGPIA